MGSNVYVHCPCTIDVEFLHLQYLLGVKVSTQLLLCYVVLNIIFGCVTPGAPRYNPQTPSIMEIKTIREYSLNRGLLNCVSYWRFADDPDNLPGDPIYLSARVEPREPACPDCMRIRVQSHSDVPPGVILDELEYFISTIKKMYEL